MIKIFFISTFILSLVFILFGEPIYASLYKNNKERELFKTQLEQKLKIKKKKLSNTPRNSNSQEENESNGQKDSTGTNLVQYKSEAVENINRDTSTKDDKNGLNINDRVKITNGRFENLIGVLKSVKRAGNKIHPEGKEYLVSIEGVSIKDEKLTYQTLNENDFIKLPKKSPSFEDDNDLPKGESEETKDKTKPQKSPSFENDDEISKGSNEDTKQIEFDENILHGKSSLLTATVKKTSTPISKKINNDSTKKDIHADHADWVILGKCYQWHSGSKFSLPLKNEIKKSEAKGEYKVRKPDPGKTIVWNKEIAQCITKKKIYSIKFELESFGKKNTDRGNAVVVSVVKNGQENSQKYHVTNPYKNDGYSNTYIFSYFEIKFSTMKIEYVYKKYDGDLYKLEPQDVQGELKLSEDSAWELSFGREVKEENKV